MKTDQSRAEQYRQVQSQDYQHAPEPDAPYLPTYEEAVSSPPSYEQAQAEYAQLAKDWEKLDPDAKDYYQRISIREQNNPTLIAARDEVHARYSYRPQYALYYNLDAYDIWLISRLARASLRFQCHLASELIKIAPHALDTFGSLAQAAVHGASHAAYAIAHGAKHAAQAIAHGAGGSASGCCGGGGGSGDDCAAGVVIGGFIALAAILASIFAAAFYAGKKACKSLANLSQGKKAVKSTTRFAGILAGAAIGAVFGSSIPVVGTAAGAVIGLCFGAFFGAAISKYVTRLVYAIKNRNMDAISKTNPEKYTLTKCRKEQLNKYDTKLMLTTLKTQKNSCSFFDSETRDAFNQLLKHIKNENIQPEGLLAAPIQTKSRNYFLCCSTQTTDWKFFWDQSKNQWGYKQLSTDTPQNQQLMHQSMG